MGGNNEGFRLRTFLVCILVIILLEVGHGLSFTIKVDMAQHQLHEQIMQINATGLPAEMRDVMINNAKNQTMQSIGISNILDLFSVAVFATDLPSPLSLIFDIMMALMALSIGYCLLMLFRIWVPFLPGN